MKPGCHGMAVQDTCANRQCHTLQSTRDVANPNLLREMAVFVECLPKHFWLCCVTN